MNTKTEQQNPAQIPINIREEIANKALTAARTSLSYLTEKKDADPEEIRGAILQAFQAADNAMEIAYKAFTEQHPGKKFWGPHLEIMHIVATAIAFIDDTDLTPDPYSIVGNRILLFSHVCTALDNTERITAIMNDGFLGGGAEESYLLTKLYPPNRR